MICNTLRWLSAAENLSAAVALILAIVTLTMTVRQIRRERQERKPNLVISSVDWHSLNKLDVEFTNLGQYPVFVRVIVHDQYHEKEPNVEVFQLLIPPGETRRDEFGVGFILKLRKGEFRFFFQYGATGSLYHRVAFAYEAAHKTDEDGGKVPLIVARTGEQKLTVNLGPENKAMRPRVVHRRLFEGLSKL